MQITDRLKALLAAHRERQSNIGGLALQVGEVLHRMFDDYVGKDIGEITEELPLMRELGDELDEENAHLLKLKTDFEATNTRLVEHLSRLKTSQESPDWALFGPCSLTRGKSWKRSKV